MKKENVIPGIEEMEPNMVSYILNKQIPKSPYIDFNILACPNCGSGEYLHNEDGNQQQYCGQCGQAIDWEEVDHE